MCNFSAVNGFEMNSETLFPKTISFVSAKYSETITMGVEVFNEADMFRYSPIISSTPLSKLTGFEPIISTNEKFNKTVSILLQTASQLANYRSYLSLNVSAVNEAISILGTDGFLIMLLEAMEFSWFYAINNALLSLGLRKLKPIEAVRW